MGTKLTEINKQAAEKASKAMSKLIGKPVRVDISRAGVKKLGELSPIIGPEEIVAGVYLPITGEVNGAALLVFPKESAFVLSDLLVGREPGTTRKLTKLNESALKEVGNIISGNYFTILSNELGVKIIEHIPNFSFDMFGAIVSQVIANFVSKGKEALVVEVEFIFKPAVLKSYLLFLIEMEDLAKVLQKKKKKKKKKKIREIFGEIEGME